MMQAWPRPHWLKEMPDIPPRLIDSATKYLDERYSGPILVCWDVAASLSRFVLSEMRKEASVEAIEALFLTASVPTEIIKSYVPAWEADFISKLSPEARDRLLGA